MQVSNGNMLVSYIENDIVLPSIVAFLYQKGGYPGWFQDPSLTERNTGKVYQFPAETAMTKLDNYPNGISLS
jgi:hypothetical protein